MPARDRSTRLEFLQILLKVILIAHCLLLVATRDRAKTRGSIPTWAACSSRKASATLQRHVECFMRTFRACLWTVLVALCTCALQSASAPTLDAGDAAEIDRMFQAAVDAREIPGVVALVTTRDRIIYLKAFGYQNVGKKIPMSTSTVFRIASMTKPITSAGIMMLYEQGKLGLDDPAGRYLPAYSHREVIHTFNASDASYTTRPAESEITIRHLLTHTSGLSYPFTSSAVLAIQTKTGTDPKDMPLQFDPGARWQYSPATAVLGEILQKLSGKSLEEWDQSQVFRPLRMGDTTYSPTPAQAARLATVHRRESGGLVEDQNPAVYTPDVRGDGGLVSTAADYAAFMRMFLNGGSLHRRQLLKPETVRLMTSNQIGELTVQTMPAAMPARSAPFPSGAGKDTFGFGFQIAATDGAAVHERGAGSYTWGGIDNTHFWVDPGNGIGVVILTQVLPFYNDTSMSVLKRFEKLIYQHLH